MSSRRRCYYEKKLEKKKTEFNNAVLEDEYVVEDDVSNGVPIKCSYSSP